MGTLQQLACPVVLVPCVVSVSGLRARVMKAEPRCQSHSSVREVQAAAVINLIAAAAWIFLAPQ